MAAVDFSLVEEAVGGPRNRRMLEDLARGRRTGLRRAPTGDARLDRFLIDLIQRRPGLRAPRSVPERARRMLDTLAAEIA